MEIFDASSELKLLESLETIFGITSKDLDFVSEYVKKNDVYYVEALSYLKKDKVKRSFKSIILHHFTNTLNISMIENKGLLTLKEWLQTNEIRKFMISNNLEIDVEQESLVYRGVKVRECDILKSNVFFRIKNGLNISAVFFKKDFYDKSNIYTGEEGRLIKAPEFIFELQKLVDVNLIESWNNQKPKKYIISFEADLDEIDYSQELIKEDLLECSLEWLITGRSFMCNEIQIKQSAKISFERIKQIEEYK